MTIRQNILLSLSILLLIALLIYIVFGKHGYSDLKLLKQEQIKFVQKNEQLKRENLAIGVEIERLNKDLGYIENIARQELGMIREEEYILKPKNQVEWEK